MAMSLVGRLLPPLLCVIGLNQRNNGKADAGPVEVVQNRLDRGSSSRRLTLQSGCALETVQHKTLKGWWHSMC